MRGDFRRERALAVSVLVLVVACATPPSATPGVTPSIGSVIPTAAPTLIGPSPSSATSPGPAAWPRIVLDPQLFVMDVASSRDRIVAVGQSPTATAWASIDGTTWTRGTVDGPVTTLSRVVSGPTGFVAFGCSTGKGGPCSIPAAWTSVDGQRWRRHPLPLTLPYGGVADVSVARGVIVAVGFATDCYFGPTGISEFKLVSASVVVCHRTAEAWWSTDGTTWQLASRLSGAGELGQVTATEDSFVTFDSSAGKGFAAWRSADGRQWSALANTRGTLAVAVGYVAGLFLAASLDAPPTGSASSVSTSADLVTWTPASSTALAGAYVVRFAPVAGGIDAVGFTGDPNTDQLQATVWATSDGTTWRMAPADPTRHTLYPVGLTEFGGRSIIAVNESSYLPADGPKGSVLLLPVGGGGQ